MADFMGSDDDTRESTSVLDDGYAVDFLKAFVNDTGPSDVGKSGGAVRTAAAFTTSAHVELGYCDGNVVNG